MTLYRTCPHCDQYVEVDTDKLHQDTRTNEPSFLCPVCRADNFLKVEPEETPDTPEPEPTRWYNFYLGCTAMLVGLGFAFIGWGVMVYFSNHH